MAEFKLVLVIEAPCDSDLAYEKLSGLDLVWGARQV